MVEKPLSESAITLILKERLSIARQKGAPPMICEGLLQHD